jgi:N-acetylglucosamine malate deacetylase 1
MSEGRIRSFIRRLLVERASPEFLLYLKHLRSSKDSGFALGRKSTVYRSVARQSVLILAPHPDDEAVGLGGTLSMHLEAGSDVTVLYMTDGSLTDPSFDPVEMAKIRRREAEALGTAYGLRQLFWETRDQTLDADPEAVMRLGELLEKIRPQSVFVPSPIDAHRDHFAANRILVGALDQRSSTAMEVFGYEIWTDIPFPNHVVEITSFFEKKLEMVAYYRSQAALCDFAGLCRSKNALNHFRHVHCLESGYAEAFLRFSAETYSDMVRDLIEIQRQ